MNNEILELVMSENIEALEEGFGDDYEETHIGFNDEDDVDVIDKLFIESVLNGKQRVWDFLKSKGFVEPIITTYYPNPFHESSTVDKCVFSGINCPKCKNLTLDINLEDNMAIKLFKGKNEYDVIESLDYPENSNCYCPQCDMFFIWCPNCGCKETKFHSIFGFTKFYEYENEKATTFFLFFGEFYPITKRKTLTNSSSKYNTMKACPVGADSSLLYEALASNTNQELVWTCLACDKHFITSAI